MVNLRAVTWSIVLSMGLFCGFQIYIRTGIVGMTKKNDGPGCICHNFDPSPDVSVWITGPDSLQAGQEAVYTISIVRDTNVAAGMNVAAWAGALGIIDSAETQLLQAAETLELTHVEPKFGNGSDTITWRFLYRAPDTSISFVDTLYAVANSVNNDTMATELDHWNFSPNFPVHVQGTTSVRVEPVVSSFILHQNHPNPFNPSTRISFTVPASPTGQARFTVLVVFDILGREVATLVNEEKAPGNYEVTWDAHGVASGMYLYRLQSGGASETKKLVLLR